MFLLLPGAYHPTEVLFLLNLLYKKKDLKVLHLWASLSQSLFRQTGLKMYVK